MKKIWEHHLMMEIEHLKEADKLLQQYEKKEAKDLLQNELPKLLKFQSNKDYVREIIESEINLTANLDDYIDVKKLEKDHRYHIYQKAANCDPVLSTTVIENSQGKCRLPICN